MLRKIIASLTVIVLFTGYALYERSTLPAPDASAFAVNDPSAGIAAPVVASASSDTDADGAQPAQSPAPAPSQPATPADTKKGRYTDGTYTGSVADAFYGNVQVQVTVADGLIADVAFLQYPDDRGETQRVSAMALPRLKSEAIAAQSAQVDGVSGATQTSEAFVQSLQSALAQA